MLQTLVISVILAITVSALCSICEAVLYSISASQVEMLKKSGDQAAFHLQKLRADIDEPITAILTLNTIANTVGAAVAGAAAAKLFGDQNFILFSGTFTLSILILQTADWAALLNCSAGIPTASSILPPNALCSR